MYKSTHRRAYEALSTPYYPALSHVTGALLPCHMLRCHRPTFLYLRHGHMAVMTRDSWGPITLATTSLSLTEFVGPREKFHRDRTRVCKSISARDADEDWNILLTFKRSTRTECVELTSYCDYQERI